MSNADNGKQPPPARGCNFLVVIVGIVVLVAWGGWSHWRTAADARETQQQTSNFVPTVRVAVAKREDQPVLLTLPGQIQVFDAANIYARATGYIAERHVDIGSRVTQGEMLLRISAPDTDAQLVQAEAQAGQNEAAVQQAQAQLQQAIANQHLAHITNGRESTLAHEGWETRQNADNAASNANTTTAAVAAAQAGIDVAQANLKAQLATVQRLQELTRFERVVAPFSGVITARNIDVGDLVTADAATAPPMFAIQRDDIVRVSAAVPQSAAVPLHDGLETEVRVPEIPDRVFHGKVARSSVALDPSSRTLLVQVDVDNPDHLLRPGLFANITFRIPRDHPGVVVPDDALVFDAAGMQVAVIDDNGTVHMRKVSIYRDFGTTAELRDGLQGGERIALNLPADVADGGKVKLTDTGEKQKPQKQQVPETSQAKTAKKG
jgi:RND family efflux transporter MFP subunit